MTARRPPARVRRVWAAAATTGLALACSACPGSTRRPDAAQSSKSPDPLDGGELIYDGGPKGDWHESGSIVRERGPAGAANVHFGDAGEWILTRTGLSGTYGALLFRVKEPPGEAEFLAVALGSGNTRPFPTVKLKPDHRTDLDDGWTQVVIPISELDPKGAPFDRVIFRPFRPFGIDGVLFDRIGLAAGSAGQGQPMATGVGGSLPTTGKPVHTRVQCEAKAAKISPFIYGFSYGEKGWPKLAPAARRWGGNAVTTYNWESHVANRGQDWFFENHPEGHYDDFLTESSAQGAQSALTVPMIGWVAKDAASYSFPVSVFGPQAKTDPYNGDAGNGVTASGANVTPGPQTRTSIAATPEYIKRWISAIRGNDAKNGKRAVYEYILDNEPGLWNSTHRDVHPDPVGYDELVERTIQYGSAIRAADPEALLAGPAEWGWSGYLFSARDLAGHPATHADRRAHGDVPLVEWYLDRLREHEQKTGVRVLDVFDLHYYPQGNNVYSGGAGGTDRETQLLRLRSTRSLWDEEYVDESWINDRVRLLPRMKEWVAKHYPGRGISIGEWNFGGDQDITGALATAEALGRFAQFGVTSAFYWTGPAIGSPPSFAFEAYRNFDALGGRFLDWYVPTTPVDGASFFASRDDDGKHVVVVAINMSPTAPLAADIDLESCGHVATSKAYAYTGGQGFVPADPSDGAAPTVHRVLQPWSITVLDIQLRDRAGAPAP